MSTLKWKVQFFDIKPAYSFPLLLFYLSACFFLFASSNYTHTHKYITKEKVIPMLVSAGGVNAGVVDKEFKDG